MMLDEWKEDAKATKFLTELFPNKVAIYMPQVCCVNSIEFYMILFLLQQMTVWLYYDRMKHFYLFGNNNWMMTTIPSK